MSLNPGGYFVSYQLKDWATAELMLREFLALLLVQGALWASPSD